MRPMFEENPFTFSPTFDERFVILGPGLGKLDARADNENEAKVLVELLFLAWKAGNEAKVKEVRDVLGIDEMPERCFEPEPQSGGLVG